MSHYDHTPIGTGSAAIHVTQLGEDTGSRHNRPQSLESHPAQRRAGQINDARATPQTSRGLPALVFLHYWGGSSRTWGPVTDRLAGSARCVALDRRSWGQSSAPAADSAIGDMAADTLAVREQVIEDSLAGSSAAEHEWTASAILEDVSADLIQIDVPVLVDR